MVTATQTEPTEHISLTDGTTTLKMLLYNAFNERDHTAIRMYPLMERAFRMVPAEGRYNDREFPYAQEIQSEFSGGIGNEDFDRDRTRYWAGNRMNTLRDGRVVLAGRINYSKGLVKETPDTYLPIYDTSYPVFKQLWSGDLGGKYTARSFTTPAGATTWTRIMILIRYIGNPTELRAGFYTNGASVPGTLVGSYGTLDYGTIDPYISHWITIPVSVSLSASTTYWVVIWDSGTPDANNHWEIAVDGVSSGGKVYNGSTWANSTPMFCRAAEAAPNATLKFFEYKGQLYSFARPHDGSAGYLWMNGYRGACDSNATDGAVYLKDTTANFGQVNAFRDYAVVRLVAGQPSALEDRPWRRVTSPSANLLEVTEDVAWSIFPHDTLTDYVVLGTNYWQKVTPTGVTKPITDVAVANQIMYLSQGNAAPVVKHREFNNNGTWQTSDYQTTQVYAQFLKVLRDVNHGDILWMARNPTDVREYRSKLWRALAPPRWDSTLLSGDVMDNCADAWDEQVVTNVTSSYTDNTVKFAVASAFTTGVLGSEAISSFNLEFSDRITFTIKVDIALNAGDLQFLVSNLANCATPLLALNLPSLKANEAQDVTLKFDTSGIANINAVISIGLQLTTNYGAFNIELTGGVTAYAGSDPITVGREAENITGLEVYDEPERLYVLGEGEFGYIEDDKYVPVQLKELAQVSDYYNMQYHTTSDIYLVFNLGQMHVERYYRQNLEDISLSNAHDLSMSGRIVGLIGYPGGKIIMAINGKGEQYSSILMYSGQGWHCLYRCSQLEDRIYSIYVQSVPGFDAKRLWFDLNHEPAWIPISVDPSGDINFLFANDGYIDTSWYYSSEYDLKKLYQAAKIFVENLTSSAQYEGISVIILYKIDLDVDWTFLFQSFDPTGLGGLEQAIGSVSNTVSAYRIRFRIIARTFTPGVSPKIKSFGVKSLTLEDVKYAFSFSTKASEDDLSINLEGDEMGSLGITGGRVETAVSKIKEWIQNGTKLTVGAVFSPIDGATVRLNSFSLQPMTVLSDDQIEEDFLNMQMEEV